MKKLLVDREGATSVLVIFMMIVLVVFATLAFTTSYANYTLSKRASVITSENYALDELAMRMTLKVDSALASAEARAQEAIAGEDVLMGRIQGLTRAQGEAVRAAIEQDDQLIGDLMNRFYLMYALEELTPLAQDFVGLDIELSEEYADGHFLDIERGNPGEESIAVTMALTTGNEKGDKQLDVALSVRPLQYDLHYAGGAIGGQRAVGFDTRYRVDAWRQWQIPHEYDDRLEFGDARIVIEDLN